MTVDEFIAYIPDDELEFHLWDMQVERGKFQMPEDMRREYEKQQTSNQLEQMKAIYKRR